MSPFHCSTVGCVLNPALILMTVFQTSPCGRCSALGRLVEVWLVQCILVALVDCEAVQAFSGATPPKLQHGSGLEQHVHTRARSLELVHAPNANLFYLLLLLLLLILFFFYRYKNVEQGCYDHIHDYNYDFVGWIFKHCLLSLFSRIIKIRPSGKGIILLYLSFDSLHKRVKCTLLSLLKCMLFTEDISFLSTLQKLTVEPSAVRFLGGWLYTGTYGKVFFFLKNTQTDKVYKRVQLD